MINRRWVPIPVPISSIAEVVEWLEGSMIPEGQALTSMVLDGVSIIEQLQDHSFVQKGKLTATSVLEVRIESALDLALHGLETAHTLCGAILKTIKFVAVHLWQCPPSQPQPELQQLVEDVDIIIDLIDHSQGLGIQQYADFGPMIDLQAHLKKILLGLSAAIAKCDWRGSAQILLRDTTTTTGLESSLRMLQEEFETAHLRVLTSRGARLG